MPVKNEDGVVIMFILNFEDLAQLIAKSAGRSLHQRLSQSWRSGGWHWGHRGRRGGGRAASSGGCVSAKPQLQRVGELSHLKRKWVEKGLFGPFVCTHRHAVCRAPPDPPGDLGMGWGRTPGTGGWRFKERTSCRLCCQPFDVSCWEGFVAPPWVPAAGRQHCVGRDRGRWHGTGATCGCFGTAGGYLVSPAAGLCHGDVTARGMHWDSPELAPALGCFPQSQAHPRVFQGFWGAVENPIAISGGGWSKGRTVARPCRGCGYQTILKLDQTMGSRGGASKYPPAIGSSVSATCILNR